MSLCLPNHSNKWINNENSPWALVHHTLTWSPASRRSLWAVPSLDLHVTSDAPNGQEGKTEKVTENGEGTGVFRQGGIPEAQITHFHTLQAKKTLTVDIPCYPPPSRSKAFSEDPKNNGLVLFRGAYFHGPTLTCVTTKSIFRRLSWTLIQEINKQKSHTHLGQGLSSPGCGGDCRPVRAVGLQFSHDEHCLVLHVVIQTLDKAHAVMNLDARKWKWSMTLNTYERQKPQRPWWKCIQSSRLSEVVGFGGGRKSVNGEAD